MTDKVIPIRQIPPSDVDTVIAKAKANNFGKIIMIGQDADGYWNFQFGGLIGKMEAIGMLEFAKLEVWESMKEVE